MERVGPNFQTLLKWEKRTWGFCFGGEITGLKYSGLNSSKAALQETFRQPWGSCLYQVRHGLLLKTIQGGAAQVRHC